MPDLLTATIPQEVAEKSNSTRSCPLCGSLQVHNFLTAPDRFHLRKDEYNLLRCSACQCVWLTGPPKLGEMGFHYSEDYHKAITTGAESSGTKRWESHRRTIAKYKQQGSILDIGCSSGSFLAGMNNGKWKLYGIELDELTAQKARAKSGAEIFVGDVMDAPFEANSFDLITCFDVLEHVYQPKEFLTKVMQWLRPGGIFFTKLPNIDSWEAKLFGSHWYGLELPRHLYHFSLPSLRHLVREVGFGEVHIAADGPGSAAGHSSRYICETIAQSVGLTPTSMAKTKRPNVAWRAIRKGMWLSLVIPLTRVASAANAGIVIDAILEKPTV